MMQQKFRISENFIKVESFRYSEYFKKDMEGFVNSRKNEICESGNIGKVTKFGKGRKISDWQIIFLRLEVSIKTEFL
jgi:hypothetical protein